MHYEIYADSLWLLNFVMNLYLLILVDRSLLRTATRRGLILGAAAGAFFYLLPFLWDAPVWIKFPAAVLLGTAAMVYSAFRPKTVRGLVRILEKLFVYSFLLGGMILFLTGSIPMLREKLMSVCGVLGAGALFFLLATYLQHVRRDRERTDTCRAILIRNGRMARVTALIDSGNSLTEPVSGRPVSVIDQELFGELWEENALFRVVPYRSVGKKQGILRGYLLAELRIEKDGIEKRFQNVYVAVGEEYAGGVRMILNPALFQDTADGIG